MSFNTLAVQATDQGLRVRVAACLQQEARTGPHAGDATSQLIIGLGTQVLDQFVWTVSDATEAAYASALAGGVPNPGSDESVITDGDIVAAVQAGWPDDA